MSVPVAQLIALLLQSLLNGAFFTLFVILILLLLNSTFSSRFHRIAFALVACFMMSFSAAHLALSFVRAVQAFVPKGPEQLANPDSYYKDFGTSLETVKAFIFIAQTVLGDGVMIWRCYVVFDKSRIVLFLSCVPLIVNLIIGVMGTAKFIQSGGHFLQQDRFYLSAFTSTTLIVNMSCSWGIVYRIWRSSREVQDLSKVCPILCAVIQSGALYAIGTLALLISCAINFDSGVYAAMDVVVPLVGIVFSLIVLQIHFHLHMSSLSHPSFAAERTSNLHTLGTLPRWRHYFSSSSFSTEHQQCQLGTTSSIPDPQLQPQRLSTYSQEDRIDRGLLSSGADARFKEASIKH